MTQKDGQAEGLALSVCCENFLPSLPLAFSPINSIMSKVIKSIFSFLPRVGVVFTGISGDSMEVKSLGKPERYPFFLVSFEGQSSNKDWYQVIICIHKQTLLFTQHTLFSAFLLMSSRQLESYSLLTENEMQQLCGLLCTDVYYDILHHCPFLKELGNWIAYSALRVCALRSSSTHNQSHVCII